MTAIRKVEFGEFTEEQIRVHRAGEALHRDGASPAGALDLLAAIIEDRTWERLTDTKGRSFKGRFRAFVETRVPYGLGFDADQLPKVIGLRHPHEGMPRVAERMAAMRVAVSEELLADIPTAAVPGGDRRSPEFQERGTLLKPPRSENAERTVRRLKRDDPTLAERVVRGEVSPNAAAREKGWRKPRIILSSPERIAESLRRYMTADDLARLITALLAPGNRTTD
jgi:hypothetical protein